MIKNMTLFADFRGGSQICLGVILLGVSVESLSQGKILEQSGNNSSSSKVYNKSGKVMVAILTLGNPTFNSLATLHLFTLSLLLFALLILAFLKL